LHIDSLEIRWLRFDLVVAYKILFNLVNVSEPHFYSCQLQLLHSVITLEDMATSWFLITHVLTRKKNFSVIG